MDRDVAERLLDRTHAFIPRIDARVSFLFTITGAQLAIAVVNLRVEDFSHLTITLLAVAYLVSAGWVVVCLYNSTFPQLENSRRSLLFFKDISGFSREDYVHAASTASPDELLEDILSQVWRNAQIVDEKYRLLRWAWRGTWVSLVLWICLLASSSWIYQRIPAVG